MIPLHRGEGFRHVMHSERRARIRAAREFADEQRKAKLRAQQWDRVKWALMLLGVTASALWALSGGVKP